MRIYGGGKDVFLIFQKKYQYGTFGIYGVYGIGICNNNSWIGSEWIWDHWEFLKIAKPRSSHSPKVLGKHYLKREKVFRGRKTPLK